MKAYSKNRQFAPTGPDATTAARFRCRCDQRYVSEMIVRIFLVSLLLAFPTWAFPAEWNSISGIYAVTAENLIDPGETEPKDSHFRIQLKGGSAKALFHAMKVNPQIDECTGATARTIGEMQCLFF